MSQQARGLNQFERLVVILRHCERLAWSEIADLLGVATYAVEETYLRIIKAQFYAE